MLEWLAMGGYALYVWGAFGMTAACMILEPWWLQRKNRALHQRMAQRYQSESEQ